MSELTYSISNKRLTWEASHYDGVSGPHGLALPIGQYTIEVRRAVTSSSLSSSFENTETGNKWFLPIKPKFSTPRSGFGIHPDGNVHGTLGCIGLLPTSATAFWRRWVSKPVASRPTSLTVIK